MGGIEAVVGGTGNVTDVVKLQGWAIGGRLSVGGVGNGIEVAGWKGCSLSPDGDCVSLFGVSCLAPPCPICLSS